MLRLLSFRGLSEAIPIVQSAKPSGKNAEPLNLRENESLKLELYVVRKEIWRVRRVLLRYLTIALMATCVLLAQHKGAVRAGKSTESCLRVQDGSFHSAALDREMKYRVLLPCSYRTGGGRFPVLYLLHGLYGDYLNWDTRTKLESYVQKYELIVVMPDAGDSWYTNSATAPQDKFEDYIAKDLVAEIDGKFRTLRSRHARAIAGLSMGGYGALKIALRYHYDFAFAGSLSGALNAPQDLSDQRPEFRDQLLRVFGPPGSAVRADNNLFTLLQSTGAKDLPYFFLACGNADNFLAINRDFVAELSSRGAAYEYHETGGGHAWDYWDRSLPDLLRTATSAVINER
jgi:putative tributyrin esterase